MPLDTTLSAKSVTATLHYQVRGDQKPVRYVGEPPPGVVAWSGIDDPREVTDVIFDHYEKRGFAMTTAEREAQLNL